MSPPSIAATSTAAVSPSESAPAGRVGSHGRRPVAEKTAKNVVPTPAVKSVATIQQIDARATTTSSKPPPADQPSVLKPVKQPPITASAPPTARPAPAAPAAPAPSLVSAPTATAERPITAVSFPPEEDRSREEG